MYNFWWFSGFPRREVAVNGKFNWRVSALASSLEVDSGLEHQHAESLTDLTVEPVLDRITMIARRQNHSQEKHPWHDEILERRGVARTPARTAQAELCSVDARGFRQELDSEPSAPFSGFFPR